MIVELVGLPGVGKSFLSRCVERQLAVRRAGGTFFTTYTGETQSRFPLELTFKILRATRFVATHAVTGLALFAIVRSSRAGLRYRTLTKFVNLLAELDRASRTSPATVRVSEQGVLQAIWSLEMLTPESIHRPLMRESERWLPEAIVFVDLDRERHVRRLRQREKGRSRFDRLSDEELPGEMARGLLEMRAILLEWRRHLPDGARLDFSNDGDGEADAASIVDWLAGAPHRVPRPSPVAKGEPMDRRSESFS